MTNCSGKDKDSCESEDSCEFVNGICKTKSASFTDYLIFSIIILVVVFLLWLLYKALVSDKSPSENQWKLLGQDW